ncbi:MAG: transporter substrate-binding domain-containing protein [Caldilineaceae bacterium]
MTQHVLQKTQWTIWSHSLQRWLGLTMLLAALLGSAIGSKKTANAAPPRQATPLQVGIFHAPPFAIEGGDGWDGIGVHLWRDAAQELELDYQLVPIASEQAVNSLTSGSVDVVIGLVANADDEAQIDFTHPYLVSSLGTAQPAQRSLREIIGAFFSPRFWQIALWLSVSFLLVGVIIWLFERNVNEEQFGRSATQGIWAGFWWAGVTMSTIGYGDKVPHSIGGRILGLLWMLVAMGITAILTASLTSILTVNSGLSATQFPGDLRQMTVGTVANSESAAFLDEERIQYQPFEQPQVGLEALHTGDLDIFVDDVAMLRFVNSEALQGALRVSASGIHPQQHAFALPADSPLREPINQVLLQRIEEPAWQSFVSRYISENQ